MFLPDKRFFGDCPSAIFWIGGEMTKIVKNLTIFAQIYFAIKYPQAVDKTVWIWYNGKELGEIILD